MFKSMKTTRTIVALGLLLACEIILARLVGTIRLWDKTFSFNFIAIAVAAYFYGAMGGILIAGLGDFIGANLFPIGPYFPGFTLTAVLTGLVWGLLLHHKHYSVLKVILAVFITQILFSQFINTYWITLISTTGKTYWVIFVGRLIQTALYLVIMPTLISMMIKAIDTIRQKPSSMKTS